VKLGWNGNVVCVCVCEYFLANVDLLNDADVIFRSMIPKRPFDRRICGWLTHVCYAPPRGA
jgi:hypothetical protein